MVIEPSISNAADVEVVDGSLIVPDILSMKLVDTKGKITYNWHHMIGVPGIIGPFTVDAEEDHLALTSWFSNEVQIWDLKGDSAVHTFHDYAVPINAILHEGEIIVAELGAAPGKAKVTKRAGDRIETLLDAKGGLIVPSGLACGNGNCYVADFYQGRLIQFLKDGKSMEATEIVADSLQQPEGIQIGPEGRIIIVETGADRVVAINSESGDMDVLVEEVNLGLPGPQGMPPTWKLSDVHFDEEGTLYVPSDVDNVIYRYFNKL